ncbi:hypothetical protein GGR20_003433 [Devosia subaequoris]|uniref:Uncharacterized protein n=1 Tax=Devosia subaequoris TaxID=395930 RepID=A0A7W6NDH8_9HYPH|nr:hypothetical protein [Devosia subaequoris]MBB4053771.1 hypothetical protein [Devosia subaequoris]MCP1211031.1 hypothetical protein [Devosia subaequoris]
MRNKFISLKAVGAFSALSFAALPALAAPVSGFEALYDAVLTNCTPPAGTPAACEAAINAYSSALVSAGVDPVVALQSFTELRSEVAAAGGGDTIEALFEQLLPESGAVGGVQASPV